ncbi:uncharacterized protein LOC135467242 [Liolophura sinensis]|uniref:uncharacterized protein LOC135467242 n=1 Tax=Liolophura sinensis TaxID=3198878 RepID=UPI003158AADA
MAVHEQDWRTILPMMQYPQTPGFPHVPYQYFNGFHGFPTYGTGLHTRTMAQCDQIKPMYILYPQMHNTLSPFHAPVTSTLPASLSSSSSTFMTYPDQNSSLQLPAAQTPVTSLSHEIPAYKLPQTPVPQISTSPASMSTPASKAISSSPVPTTSPSQIPKPLAPKPQASHVTILPSPISWTSQISPLTSTLGNFASYNSRSALSKTDGCHRVIIQGSNVNYLSHSPAAFPSNPQPLQTPVNGAVETSAPVQQSRDSPNAGVVFDTSRPTSANSSINSQRHSASLTDFSNLDLLSTVSLLQEIPKDNVHKKVPYSRQSALPISSNKSLADDINTFPRTSTPETPATMSPSRASALDLVPAKMVEKPSVWLNVTLQVDTSGEIKRGQQGVQYRSLITNIVTELFYPPNLCPPDDLVVDVLTATASYDDRGRLTVLEVKYITPGIFKVDCQDGHGKTTASGKCSRKVVTLTRLDSLETLCPKSQYWMIGDLCPVPRTFQKCHRNAPTLYKKLTEYLYTKEFRKYTLPLLLKNGEEDVWTTSLKVPRTRSRVSDYDDLAVGEQSLKRKASSDSERSHSPDITKTLFTLKRRKKLSRASSETSIISTSSSGSSCHSSRTSSPCTSPTPSLISFPSIEAADLLSDESRDTVGSNPPECPFVPISPPKLQKEVDQFPCSNNLYSSPPRLRLQRSRGQRTNIYNSV